jgi:hypothetical protein
MELWQILETFNRKERNLLIRAALGENAERPPLSDSFRSQVASELRISMPREAWWATDYHISWIAGALCVYTKGKEEAGKPQPNPELKEHGARRQLVERNQEDIDLVVLASEHPIEHLIFIEAKGYGDWRSSQLSSKMERLELLDRYYHSLGYENDRPIKFHLLLTSLSEPENLRVKGPSWASREGRIPWIPLDLAYLGPRLTVESRDKIWQVKKARERGRVDPKS